MKKEEIDSLIEEMFRNVSCAPSHAMATATAKVLELIVRQNLQIIQQNNVIEGLMDDLMHEITSRY